VNICIKLYSCSQHFADDIRQINDFECGDITMGLITAIGLDCCNVFLRTMPIGCSQSQDISVLKYFLVQNSCHAAGVSTCLEKSVISIYISAILCIIIPHRASTTALTANVPTRLASGTREYRAAPTQQFAS